MIRVNKKALKSAVETDWSKAKIKAWGRGIGNIYVVDIDKETRTFIWVTFDGASFKLRKTDFFGSFGESNHAFLRKTEFGLLSDYEPPLPPQKEACDGDGCGVKLPPDAGFKVEATCLENNDPEDDFKAHLCHECFGRMEEDWFKKCQ